MRKSPEITWRYFFLEAKLAMIKLVSSASSVSGFKLLTGKKSLKKIDPLLIKLIK